MAYVTGSVNSLNELLSAIRGACTSNGWTLSGSILHKGNIYIETEDSGGPPATSVRFRPGTGRTGENVLTGSAPNSVRLAPYGQAYTYPMIYEVHINTDPDEVYVVINYSSEFYQWAAFGISDIPGLPGSGVWAGASNANGPAGSILIQPNSAGSIFSSGIHPAIGGVNNVNSNLQNFFIHHGFDSLEWNSSFLNGTNQPKTWEALVPLQGILPNAWNGETVLLPIQIWLDRATGNKVSLAADLRNARFCRIDHHDPGDIITLGADQWKIYPHYRKQAGVTSGNSIQSSGVYGWAVRYTGGG